MNTESFGKRTISQVTIDEGELGPSNTNLMQSEKSEVLANAKKPKTLLRKYGTDYIKYGLTYIGTMNKVRKKICCRLGPVWKMSQQDMKIIVMISFQLSLLIAKNSVSHTTGKNMLLSLSQPLCLTKNKEKIRERPLSNRIKRICLRM